MRAERGNAAAISNDRSGRRTPDEAVYASFLWKIPPSWLRSLCPASKSKDRARLSYNSFSLSLLARVNAAGG
jgi:hypothetical protein